jgi:hypothetical protein
MVDPVSRDSALSLVCPNCGNYTDRPLNEETGWCVTCSPTATISNNYLANNADEIEHYMEQGHSLNRAIDLLHHENGRPHCLVCGDVIKRARRNAVFCRSKPQCRRYSRRYVYLYRERNLSKSEALSIIFQELT